LPATTGGFAALVMFGRETFGIHCVSMRSGSRGLIEVGGIIGELPNCCEVIIGELPNGWAGGTVLKGVDEPNGIDGGGPPDMDAPIAAGGKDPKELDAGGVNERGRGGIDSMPHGRLGGGV